METKPESNSREIRKIYSDNKSTHVSIKKKKLNKNFVAKFATKNLACLKLRQQISDTNSQIFWLLVLFYHFDKWCHIIFILQTKRNQQLQTSMCSSRSGTNRCLKRQCVLHEAEPTDVWNVNVFFTKRNQQMFETSMCSSRSGTNRCLKRQCVLHEAEPTDVWNVNVFFTKHNQQMFETSMCSSRSGTNRCLKRQCVLHEAL